MADTDVELVIKIPKTLISELDDDNYQSVISWYDTTLYCAIKDGIVLTKGHGDLIDKNKLAHKMIIEDVGRFKEEPEALAGLFLRMCNKEQTIIEADIDVPSPEEEIDR